MQEGNFRRCGEDHEKTVSLSIQVDGEFKSRLQTTAMAFRYPTWKHLGHTPPPPRPFGWFGGTVAVNADRCKVDFEVSVHLREQEELANKYGIRASRKLSFIPRIELMKIYAQGI
jgi:hypothetical protein